MLWLNNGGTNMEQRIETMRILSEEMIKALEFQRKLVGTKDALTDIMLLFDVAKEIHKETCSKCGNMKHFHKETVDRHGCGCVKDVMFG